MSADLFAVFGASDKPSKAEHADQSWNVSQSGPASAILAKTHHTPTSNVDVLFDADEADAEDDFGDFEDVEEASVLKDTVAAQQQSKAGVAEVSSAADQFNLLDLGDEPPPINPTKSQHPAPAVAPDLNTATVETDEWGDFEDFAPENQSSSKPAAKATIPKVVPLPLPQTAPKQTTTKNEDWDEFEDWNTNQSTTADEPSDSQPTASMPRPELPNEPAPSNIPPPTILLQLLPQVFESIHEFAQSATSEVEVEETAASIVTVFNVSARVIAGRSHRWKRDTYLAQSTRIGPSTSGARSGGMKLTAVNKSETIREEREAADVCDAWSRNTYIFAGIVSRSEHRRPWMNLNIKMTPRPSPGFGTLESREPCGLCGIKRDERIAGVDFDADDVFDEYWTEHWGHTDCKVFWYTYRDMLDQR